MRSPVVHLVKSQPFFKPGLGDGTFSSNIVFAKHIVGWLICQTTLTWPALQWTPSLLCALYKCNAMKKAFFFIGCFFPLARALLVDAAKRSDICRLLKKMDEILEVDQTWETMNNEMLQEVVKRSDVFIQGDIDWKCLTPMPGLLISRAEMPVVAGTSVMTSSGQILERV